MSELTAPHFGRNSKAELDDIFYFLYEDLMVDFDSNARRSDSSLRKPM